MADSPDADRLNAHRAQLNALVVNVELTLVSIIQGVALYFLADSTRQLILTQSLEYYLYALNGLLIIFLFWSRAVIHTFTVIRWPLEFSHNFLYITCALFEALAFANLSQPVLWNALQAVFAGLVWLLFAIDLRLVKARQREFTGSRFTPLFATVRKDQMLNIAGLIPVFIGFHLVVAGFLWRRQATGGSLRIHLYCAGLQTLALSGYLIYLVRYFSQISPLLVFDVPLDDA
ncbi:MAG TPA: hypothetical protein VGD78_06055 [Chthoniobacterales bacterium]